MAGEHRVLILGRFVAALSLLLVVFLSVLPWGLSETGRLAMALAPGIVISYWCARSDRLLPVLGVFVAGLLMDVLSGDTLGYWALVYLCGYGAAVALWQFGFIGIGVWVVVFPLVACVMLMVVCGLQTVVFGTPVSIWPVIGAFGLVVVAYPFVYGVLRLLDGTRSRVETGGYVA